MIAWSLAVVTAIIYLLVVIWRPLSPNAPTYDLRLWQAIHPGFSWTIGGALLGLAESVIAMVIVAVILVPISNYFHRRFA